MAMKMVRVPSTKCWCTKSVYVSHVVRTSGFRTDEEILPVVQLSAVEVEDAKS
jgi:hypothetical protein